MTVDHPVLAAALLCIQGSIAVKKKCIAHEIPDWSCSIFDSKNHVTESISKGDIGRIRRVVQIRITTIMSVAGVHRKNFE